MQLSAKGYSQGITLSLKDASLKQLFKSVEQQTDFRFVYSREAMEQSKPVSIDVKNESLENVLRLSFSKQPLTYLVEEKLIIIKIDKKKTETSILLIDVKGRIVNENGEGVVATISGKGTTNAVSSDIEGYFTLKDVDANSVIVISGINIVTRELQLNGRSELGILIIHTKIIEGSEVKLLSTGYQFIPKERATGSFEQPDKTLFNSRVSTDVLSKLEGITSGVLFNTPGITGANDAEIVIRGRSTIFANSQPLIIVDNFPYESDIRNINPNDVESITILKDAAASSIWGVRAGNGVIVITTKQGKINEPLRISVNGNITIRKKPNLFYDPGFLNTPDFIDVEKNLFDQGFYDGSISTGYEALTPVAEILRQQRDGLINQTDASAKIDALKNNDIRRGLSKYFYRNAINQQYSVNISGGGKNNNYYYSFGYDKDLTNQVKNDYERFTVNTLNTIFPVKNLSFSAGINYIYSKSASDNTLSSLLTAFKSSIYPYAAVADESGIALPVETQYSQSFLESSVAKGFLDWKFYPLTELRKGMYSGQERDNDIRIFGNLSYKILKGLSIEFKYQYQKSTSNNQNLARAESYYTRNLVNMYSGTDADGNVISYNINPGSILSASISSIETNNARGQLTYNNAWGRNNVSAIIGAEVKESNGTGSGNFYYGYDESTGVFQNINTTSAFVLNPYGYTATIPIAAQSLSGTTDRFRSYFENAAYTYNRKYTVSVSGRIDASNYFGVRTNQKKVPLWSAGGKWDIDKESFYHVGWLPYLRLRVTYGYSGNLDKSVTAVTTFKYFDFPSYLTNLNYAGISNLGNPELRWEKMGVFNAGIDFESKNKILQGTIEYYYKSGRDLIGDAIVDPTTGVEQIRGNFSRMKGKGIDIRLTSMNVNKIFKWTTTVILNWNTDQVTKYDGRIVPSNLIASDKSLYPEAGKPLFGIYSYKWAGLDPLTGDPQGYDAQKQVSKDYPALVNPDSFDDIVYSGPARPQIFGGVINHLSYRGFTLSIGLSYKLRYYFRSSSVNYYGLFYNLAGHKEFSDRWKNPGDELHTHVPSMPTVANVDPNRDMFYNYSEINVQKGDHFRIQDINLSYDLAQVHKLSIPVSSLQFFMNLSNPGIIWRANHKGLDPDYPSGILPRGSISVGIKSIF